MCLLACCLAMIDHLGNLLLMFNVISGILGTLVFLAFAKFLVKACAYLE